MPKDGGDALRYTVFDFAGTGGVAMAMFNTDAVRVASMGDFTF